MCLEDETDLEASLHTRSEFGGGRGSLRFVDGGIPVVLDDRRRSLTEGGSLQVKTCFYTQVDVGSYIVVSTQQ